MTPTLDDARDAADRVEFHFNADDSVNMKLLHEFLDAMKACKVPITPGRPERDFYVIEGAIQSGFEFIDDDAELLVVSAEKLMAFVCLYRNQAIDKLTPVWTQGFTYGLLVGTLVTVVISSITIAVFR